MPYCESGSGSGITRIFYRRYGHGSTKVLLIIGLAATHESWGPQIRGLTGTNEPNDEESPAGGRLDCFGDEDRQGMEAEEEEAGIEVCCFDNRGIGRSSVPTNKSEYTTITMAKDALGVLDHLGWSKAHVFGHSMGGMIACKLASMAPNRICSLALLNVTGGGFECFPKIDWKMLSLAYRFLRAKNPEQRAMVDLETHYTKEYLDEYVASSTRRKILYQEYVKTISQSGMQSDYGFVGQVNACWTHKMTGQELESIRLAGFLVSIIHGRYDIIARLCHARRLAEKLHPVARIVELHGAHLVCHERPDEVNQSLMELIKASKSNIKPQDWINVPVESETFKLRMTLSTGNGTAATCLLTAYDFIRKLQLALLYLFGILMMAFEHMRNIIKMMKPMKVVASDF